MAKQLKLYNGRAGVLKNHADARQKGIDLDRECHAFVAAYSVADAVRLIEEYNGGRSATTELNKYWAKGVWGNSMQDITPERGIWLQVGRWSKDVKTIRLV